MRSFVAAIAVSALPCVGDAETLTNEIDLFLKDQIDFRDSEFIACFGQQSCTVGKVTVTAERWDPDLDRWDTAQLYWTPIDGLGVLEGGQNDEIDFDERIVVQFDEPAELDGFWLSNMFVREHQVYATDYNIETDAESARVELFLGDAPVQEYLARGEDPLPDDPFNELVYDAFEEDGDLLNRMLIEEGTISILVARQGQSSGPSVIRSRIGSVDRDKLEIFAGVEVVEIAIDELLGEARFEPVLTAGRFNENQMSALLANVAQLDAMNARARMFRASGARSNGEVGERFDVPVRADRIVFGADVETSNDFTVAGIMLATGERLPSGGVDLGAVID